MSLKELREKKDLVFQFEQIHQMEIVGYTTKEIAIRLGKTEDEVKEMIRRGKELINGNMEIK